jgi:hypothetical protein
MGHSRFDGYLGYRPGRLAGRDLGRWRLAHWLGAAGYLFLLLLFAAFGFSVGVFIFW